MKLKTLWKRCRGQGRAPAVILFLLLEARTPKPFQPLTLDESIAVLDDAIEWLRDEVRAVLAMPDGPAKTLRWTELRGRDGSLARDFERLARRQQGQA